jgi:hypothetical protein
MLNHSTFYMPYFYNDRVHVLLLHIPKTGGTSINKYLCKKYEIPLNREALYSVKSGEFFKGISPQHQFYSTIKENPEAFPVKWDSDPKMQIIASVRNPYHRAVSAMLFHAFITHDTTPVDFFDLLPRFLKANWVDNHNAPQYKFVTLEDGSMAPGLQVIKTENLTDDMQQLGFTDFDLFINKCSEPHRPYMTYLDNRALKMINEHYKKDFELFGYTMVWSSSEN